jgi:hypothetical protein
MPLPTGQRLDTQREEVLADQVKQLDYSLHKVVGLPDAYFIITNQSLNGPRSKDAPDVFSLVSSDRLTLEQAERWVEAERARRWR